MGRPRLSGDSQTGTSRDEIIAAAAHLFARDGYAGTTMSAIAAAVGIRQPSLYYWFKRKELILQAVFDVNFGTLHFLSQVAAASGSPALKLYRLLRFDTHQLCLSPCDFNEVERIAEEQPDLFAEFFGDYRRLQDWVVAFIKAGVDEGQFVECDAELSAMGFLAFNEGMQKRFRMRQTHAPGSGNSYQYRSYEARELAEFVAGTTLRSILIDPVELERVQASAAAYQDDPSGQLAAHAAARPSAAP